jgi:hypothetical protein
LRSAALARELWIIDDFLDDPHAARRTALAQEFLPASRRGGANWPGTQTSSQPCQFDMQRIADALGRDLCWDSADTGAWRLTPAQSSARCDIHVDSHGEGAIYAAVLYLSLPEHCQGGTGFWRHRQTGWERKPAADELAAAGYASWRAFEQRWIPVAEVSGFAALQAARRDWEQLFELPMRFNRLVVYRSDFFHAIGEVFGTTAENSRLVQLFYFRAA